MFVVSSGSHAASASFQIDLRVSPVVLSLCLSSSEPRLVVDAGAPQTATAACGSARPHEVLHGGVSCSQFEVVHGAVDVARSGGTLQADPPFRRISMSRSLARPPLQGLAMQTGPPALVKLLLLQARWTSRHHRPSLSLPLCDASRAAEDLPWPGTPPILAGAARHRHQSEGGRDGLLLCSQSHASKKASKVAEKSREDLFARQVPPEAAALALLFFHTPLLDAQS